MVGRRGVDDGMSPVLLPPTPVGIVLLLLSAEVLSFGGSAVNFSSSVSSSTRRHSLPGVLL